MKLIYGYIDPTNGFLRYVGRSSSGMKRPRRLDRHTGRCGNWLRSLGSRGLAPEIVVLENLPDSADDSEINAAEIRCIAYARTCLAADLTNLTDGGDGVNRIFTEEHRANLSHASAGKPKSEAHRAKLAAALLGRRLTPEQRSKLCGRSPSAETRDKQSLATKGRTKSPEHRAKIAAALKGKPKSHEHTAKSAAARRGHCYQSEAGRLASSLRMRGNKLKRFGGLKHSAETKAKLSAAAKERLAKK